MYKKWHKDIFNGALAKIYLKKRCTIINKCVTFATSKNVVLQGLCLYLYDKIMICVKNHTMNVKSL